LISGPIAVDDSDDQQKTWSESQDLSFDFDQVVDSRFNSEDDEEEFNLNQKRRKCLSSPKSGAGYY
jgi:hypothetical protein